MNAEPNSSSKLSMLNGLLASNQSATEPQSLPTEAPDLAGFADPVTESSENESQSQSTIISPTEPADLPRVPGGDYDYVIGSSDDHFEGIFVRGDVNLVAGLSGSGKSTLLIKWLEEQRRKIPILDRPTFGLPYTVCLEDRSKRSFRRTLKRLRISETEIPVRRIDPKLPLAQWLEITLQTEKVRPAIVFIEGLDLALAKHKDMDEVSTVLRRLGGIAEYHHIAIIGSVGSPKVKNGEDYEALRSTSGVTQNRPMRVT
jgi:predicted ATP-dependent serine protease